MDWNELLGSHPTIEETEPPAAKRKKETKAGQKPKSHHCHVLNKSEKNIVKTHISSLSKDSVMLSCLLNVSKQLEHVNNSSKQFCDSQATPDLLFLTKDLQETFVRIYGEVSTVKEHYLQFQLTWLFTQALHRSSCLITCLP